MFNRRKCRNCSNFTENNDEETVCLVNNEILTEEKLAQSDCNEWAEKYPVREISSKPVHYCDGIKVYYTEDSGNARQFADEINAKKQNMFSDYATVYPVGYGAIITVTHPYND